MLLRLIAQMLDSLCHSGAMFYHPETVPEEPCSEISLTEVEAEKNGQYADAALFAQNVPGGSKYRPGATAGKSYYPPECHPGHVEIIMPAKGVPDFFLNRSWQRLDDRRVRVLLPGTRHTERYCDNAGYILFWLISLPHELLFYRTTWEAGKGYGQSGYRVSVAPPQANALWKCGRNLPVDESHFFALLTQCLDFALQNDLVQTSSASYQQLVLEQVKEYLEHCYATRIRLYDLARMAHYSPVYLNRLFVRRYGMPVCRYLQKLRLEEAKKRLRRGDPVGVAARASGFEDQRYFSKFFRSETGVAPSMYREDN